MMSEKEKQILLSLLDKFVEVCTKHHLIYYLAGGTCLGAVRHKGFIPWDDDIDVYMPRPDYERLRALSPSEWGGDCYKLQDWRSDNKYRYDFLKFERLDTTLLERYYPNYHGAIFLDVFPLDYYPNDKATIRYLEKQLKCIGKKYIECTIKNDNECHTIFELLLLKCKRKKYNHRKWMEHWERVVSQWGTGDLAADCHNYFYTHGGMPAEWFGEGCFVEFEGRKLLAPSQTEKYLTHMYGDYMQLPPQEKRVAHQFDYVNAERRLNDEEVEEQFRKIHQKIDYHFSLKREIKYFLRNICHIKF